MGVKLSFRDTKKLTGVTAPDPVSGGEDRVRKYSQLHGFVLSWIGRRSQTAATEPYIIVSQEGWSFWLRALNSLCGPILQSLPWAEKVDG